MSLEARYRAYTLSRPSRGATAVAAPSVAVVGVYRGFIQPVGGAESTQFAALNETFTHRLYTPVDVPVRYGDTVTQDGLTWRVVFAAQPTGIAGVNHHREVLLGHV